MNFIRASVLGRGEEDPQLERQRPPDVEEQTQSGSRLFGNGRPTIPRLFARRPSLGARAPPSEDDGPKSPTPGSLSSLARTRIQNIPSLENGIHDSETLSQSSRARTRTQRFPILTRPRAAQTNGGESQQNVRRSTFNGSGLAELHLADLAESGRHRQRDNSGSSRRRQRKEPPKRFLFCFPWVKSRRARLLILRCFVSGVFLISMLTIYLSLSITKNINTSEFSILLILLILLTTVFFCHGLILLCMLLVRPRNRQGGSGNDIEASKYGHPEYAIPIQPIRVVLARDEEAAGIESEAAKLRPPAYGLWRESVRVDPNRLYWQRAQSPPPSSPTSIPSSNGDNDEGNGPRIAQRRPPSYASDDGVDYVVDARPRSIAPPPSSIYSQTSTTDTPVILNTTDVPPLPHPALTEVSRPMVAGRLGNGSIVAHGQGGGPDGRETRYVERHPEFMYVGSCGVHGHTSPFVGSGVFC
ncbi:hypothetical protein F4801DRAFT_366348 [Xylaria longipes]|nr:hypothetical protein F4801DRAFT_366348 [Xylaria longipes]